MVKLAGLGAFLVVIYACCCCQMGTWLGPDRPPIGGPPWAWRMPGSAEEKTITVPAGRDLPGIPVYPGARQLSETITLPATVAEQVGAALQDSRAQRRLYRTSDRALDVVAWYRQEMADRGWSERSVLELEHLGGLLRFADEGVRSSCFIAIMPDRAKNSTQIFLVQTAE